MDYSVFTLCVILTLTVTLTVSVELYPPKPMGTLTIYDWSFTDEETTGKYMLQPNLFVFYRCKLLSDDIKRESNRNSKNALTIPSMTLKIKKYIIN